MYVTKASGVKEEFQPDKILRTCIRARATQRLAEKVVKEIEKKAYDGISTREILQMTLALLEKQMPDVAARYDLKGSIMRLGPAGFEFEELVAEILNEYNYKTSTDVIVSGGCIDHEIDVIAENQKRYMIECKYHNMPGIYTGIRDVLYIWARFIDLQDGYKLGKCKKFDKPWLVCNTKFSADAIKYATCKGMQLIGWRWPKEQSLERMIEKKKLYPITALRRLDKDSQQRLVFAKIMLCKNLVEMDIKELEKITGIDRRKLNILMNEAKGVLSK